MSNTPWASMVGCFEQCDKCKSLIKDTEKFYVNGEDGETLCCKCFETISEAGETAKDGEDEQ